MSQDQPPEQHSLDQPFHRSARLWNHGVGTALFEIMIVAVGVMLALAVDEWREKSEQRQLAVEARATLRAEILTNREAVFSRLRRIAQLYVLADAHPDRVGDYVFERRNMALRINDAAWTMAIETGALRWLSAEERASIASIYAGHQRMRDVVDQEMSVWAELAAFQSEADSPEMARERNRAIRVWQAFAQRTQLAQCASIGRYERALGAKISDEALIEFCRTWPPTEDPANLYREWEKFGWVKSTKPKMLTQPAPR